MYLNSTETEKEVVAFRVSWIVSMTQACTNAFWHRFSRKWCSLWKEVFLKSVKKRNYGPFFILFEFQILLEYRRYVVSTYVIGYKNPQNATTSFFCQCLKAKQPVSISMDMNEQNFSYLIVVSYCEMQPIYDTLWGKKSDIKILNFFFVYLQRRLNHKLP